MTTIEAIAHGLPDADLKIVKNQADHFRWYKRYSVPPKGIRLLNWQGTGAPYGVIINNHEWGGLNNYPLPSKEAVAEHWLDLLGRHANI